MAVRRHATVQHARRSLLLFTVRRGRFGEHRIVQLPLIRRDLVVHESEVLMRIRRHIHVRSVRHHRFDHRWISVDNLLVMLPSSACRFGDRRLPLKEMAAEELLVLSPANEENDQENHDEQGDHAEYHAENDLNRSVVRLIGCFDHGEHLLCTVQTSNGTGFTVVRRAIDR